MYVEAIQKNYKHIHYGRVGVQDKKSKKFVLIVQFIPFDEISNGKYEEYEELTKTLDS